MDYEEKYEQAMFRMNKWAEGSEITDPKEVAEFVFPELKESEDEKIRKSLIILLQHFCKGYRVSGLEFPVSYKDMLAWLKKQGTKESKKTSIWNHWKDGIAGNGEGRLIYLIKNGNDYRLSSNLGFECDYIKLSDLDELMLSEKQGEQKPAWSEEDEKEISKLIKFFMWEDTEYRFTIEDCLEATNWLKSLKERMKGE